jgi:hypothetical protein
MKATELRIGNLVNYLIEDNFEDPSKWYQETYIDAEDLLILSKKGCDNYQPIPLTEEWLLKFGFIDLNERCGLKGIFSIINKHIYINIETMSYCEIDYEQNIIDIIIVQHVHQLQNLYFALTGEELIYESND